MDTNNQIISGNQGSEEGISRGDLKKGFQEGISGNQGSEEGILRGDFRESGF